MIADADRGAFEIVPSAAHGGDGAFESEQAFGGGASEGHDASGFHNRDFLSDEGQAGGHFVGGGFAIVRGLPRGGGAEFHDVREIDVLAGEAHGFQDVIELLAGGTDEGFALDFLPIAGRLADEHHARLGISRGEDHDIAQGAQLASGWPVLRLALERGDFFVAIAGGGCFENGRFLGFRRRRFVRGGPWRRISAVPGAEEKLAEALARAFVEVNVGDAASAGGFQEIQDNIDRTAHGGTLDSHPSGCNRRLLPLPGGGNADRFPPTAMFRKHPALSAPSWYSAPELWRKLGKAAASAGRKTLLTALTLFHCLQDKDTPAWAKGVIVGALGYLILPADLIPDILPGIGYGDDLGALVAALGTVAAYIKDEHKTKAEAQVDRLFGKPDAPPPPDFIE